MKFLGKVRSGFSPVLIVVIVVAVGLVGLLGYVAYDRFVANNDDSSEVVEQSAVADDMADITTAGPEEVTNTADLDEALTTLDKITADETTDDVGVVTKEVSEF